MTPEVGSGPLVCLHHRVVLADLQQVVDPMSRVLSYSSLGREHVIAFLLGREPVMVGEGADFFMAVVPDSLVGMPLGDSAIGARTGLMVIAIEDDGRTLTNPEPSTPLPAQARLLMLGTPQQRELFAQTFA